jgi:hypothetical protein
MSIHRRMIAGFIIALMAVGLLPALAAAQSKTPQSVQVQTLGLPVPGNNAKFIMTPAYGGGLGDINHVASVHWDPTLVPGLGQSMRVLQDPVVGKDNIGFFNASEQVLTFQIEVGNEKRTVTLAAREVLTMPVPNAAEVKGTIGSGAVDTSTALTRGAIYRLRAEANKWVFAKF